VPDDVTISYRGASYEIGRAPAYYGIWRVGEPRSQPLEWWPDTTEGWYSAWSRFTSLEVPGTIAPAAEVPGTIAPAAEVAVPDAGAGAPGRAVVAGVLIGIGVVCGVVGLFPDYLDGASLASQPAELVPHAVYFAAWSASALLIASGRARWRMGALLGIGTSLVTFGFFLADAGTAIAGGAHLMGNGLVLGLIGWLACAAGSTIALVARGERGEPDRPRRTDLFPLLAMTFCAIGVAAAFAPSWDSYTLQTAAGTTESVTAGNVFSNPAPIIAGNVAVMIAIVAIVVVAAMWRPVHHGTLLLAGAVVPMAAQAISALVQVGEATTPAMFGISSATATRTGLTITSGLTLAFWIYCIFVVLLVVAAASALAAPRPVAANAGWAGPSVGTSPQSNVPSDLAWPERPDVAEPRAEQFPGPADGSGEDTGASP